MTAYNNSLSGPFVFDDLPAIAENPSIRRLWPPSEALVPRLDGGLTVSGRPLVNLSLAINYAWSGDKAWSYHLVNLLIHVSAGLALFGIARRTFSQPGLVGRFGDAALWLAFSVALIWLLHPLQTESVTYVVQRAESLMGLCYLLTIFCFVRSIESLRSGYWLGLSLTACLLGMAAKEVMVSAPLMVFLYDRTFVAGSFGEAWRRRRVYYLGMGATWALLGWLAIGTTGRGGAAARVGFRRAVFFSNPGTKLQPRARGLANHGRTPDVSAVDRAGDADGGRTLRLVGAAELPRLRRAGRGLRLTHAAAQCRLSQRAGVVV